MKVPPGSYKMPAKRCIRCVYSALDCECLHCTYPNIVPPRRPRSEFDSYDTYIKVWEEWDELFLADDKSAIVSDFGSCDHYRLDDPEDTDVEEKDDEIKLDMSAGPTVIDHVMYIASVIKEVRGDHKGEDWRGFVECPKCKGQIAVVLHRDNNHVHGMCATDKCLSWSQ